MTSNKQWADLNDEELLKVRIKDLGLLIEQSSVFPFIEQVYQELERVGLTFRPRLYFGDEWFSPEGVVAVAIPFFLAHPRLRG